MSYKLDHNDPTEPTNGSVSSPGRRYASASLQLESEIQSGQPNAGRQVKPTGNMLASGD